ncbi:hypothetical protein FRZ06_00010 [Anoxybacterium hadale]|uniref:Uncharacterized protein n=1 Tax=Anoxybacterium hadale TaxID=3408580 RepID=A0ACD1A649_9FIRM|nr:hypothetical protein FRZ06_00010 [Clostridiales bacterium]
MEIADLTQMLVRSRLLQNEKQVQEFEQSIERMKSMNSDDCMKNLCLGFDDETENDEVMFGLVHSIESMRIKWISSKVIKRNFGRYGILQRLMFTPISGNFPGIGSIPLSLLK